MDLNETGCSPESDDNSTCLSSAEAEPDPDEYVIPIRTVLVGVLIPLIGSCGSIGIENFGKQFCFMTSCKGNIFTLVVFSQIKVRRCFDDLLCGLAVYDLMYLIFGGIGYFGRVYLRDYSIFKICLTYIFYPMR